MFDEGKLNEAQSTFWKTKPVEELYDLETDPKETRNLSELKKGIAIEMRGRILDWMLTASESEQIAEHWLVPWKA